MNTEQIMEENMFAKLDLMDADDVLHVNDRVSTRGYNTFVLRIFNRCHRVDEKRRESRIS